MQDKASTRQIIQCERCTEQIATLRLTLVTFQGDLLDMEKVCRQCARDVGMIP